MGESFGAEWMDRNLRDEIDSRDHLLLDNVVDRILSKVTAVSDYEIELQIHDLIIKNVRYVNDNKRSEHTIEGPLLNKKAVCEGIAKSVKYLLNKKSIKCELAVGKLSKDKDVLHAWNVVFIEGKWYHLDVTSDLGLSTGDTTRYDYFNLSDDEIRKDHIIIDCPIACTISKSDYYYRNGLVMYTQSDFVDYLLKHIGRNRTIITFRLPSVNDPNGIVDKILGNTNMVLEMKPVQNGRTVIVRSNLTQLVFTVEIS